MSEKNLSAVLLDTDTLIAESDTLGIPGDPDVSRLQWQLTGLWGVHADKVWPDYTGDGIKVAVLDDGFEYTHPELAANYRTDLDLDTLGNDSDAMADGDDFHGTSVLGTILADDNGTGTVGVAFDAQAIGIRQGYGAEGSLLQTLTGFQYALSADADVMNNSWGYTTPFADDAGKEFTGIDIYQITDAIQTLADYGRGGDGTSVVFSAGNNRAGGDNVNYHNMQNSPYVITVAAIDSNGVVGYFSTPGAAILVSAGGLYDWTVDRTGSNGYASGNYTYFSGTSASAPVVTGVIALMLDANPDLGWRDVQQILAYSAQFNDPSSAGWHYNGATNWNGGGLHFSHDYGFGAVDARAAVRLAEHWAEYQVSANMTTFSTGTMHPALAIPQTGTVTTTVNVTQDIDIEHVLIDLDITHARAGDLVVTLISPDGTESVLVNHPSNGAFTGIYGINGIDFEMSSNAHLAEGSAGLWTLKIQDTVSGSGGTLNAWGLTFLGQTPSADNQYIYTDDFVKFAASDITRHTLTDNNGGTDTVNFSTVTYDVQLTMISGAGQTVFQDHGGTQYGAPLYITAGSVIENAVLGDGNDYVFGNDADNHIYGGRGDDFIVNSAGNDVMDGGAGTDTARFQEFVYNYTFDFSTPGTLVSIHSHPMSDVNYGTDIWTNFEYFSFSDGTFTMDELMELAHINTLTGGTGDDLYSWGTGSGATAIIDAGGTDTVAVNGLMPENLSFSANGGDLVVQSLLSLSDTLTLTGQFGVNAIETLVFADGFKIPLTDFSHWKTGTSGVDAMYGDATAGYKDVMFGGGGNDTIKGYNNDDILSGDAGNDKLYGGNGNDALHGGSGNDTLFGEAGNDTLWGGTGDDIVNGGAGDDIMNGGDGVDTLSYSDATGAVTVSLLLSAAQNTGMGFDILSGFENLTGSAYNDMLTGDMCDNVITGGSGDDRMNGGGAGNDTFIGGAGDDTVSYLDYTGTVTVVTTASGYTVTHGAFTDTLTGIEHILLPASSNPSSGDNIYNVSFTASQSIADQGGNDTLHLTGVFFEDLSFAVTGADLMISNGVNTVTLNGQAGSDASHYIETLAFDDGLTLDLGHYAQWSFVTADANGTPSADTIVDNADGHAVHGLALDDILIGMAGNDALYGESGNDTLRGGDGNDLIDGGAGNDRLYGGNGDDIFVWGPGSGVDRVSDTGGTDTIAAHGILPENVIFSVSGDDLIIAYGADSITIAGQLASGTSQKIEQITFDDGFSIALTDYAHWKTGTSGVDAMYGDAVAGYKDVMLGGAGNDGMKGYNNDDILSGDAGNDKLYGGNGNDALHGGSGNDVLYGDAGDDVLWGGTGADTLSGGAGADRFVFDPSTASIDTITDFNPAEDILDLSHLIAGFDPVTQAIADFVQITDNGGNSIVKVDLDGTGSSSSWIQVATLTGVTGLTDEQALMTSGHLTA